MRRLATSRVRVRPTPPPARRRNEEEEEEPQQARDCAARLAELRAAAEWHTARDGTRSSNRIAAYSPEKVGLLGADRARRLNALSRPLRAAAVR